MSSFNLNIFSMKQQIDLLKAGIDPQTGYHFTNDTILQSKNNKLLFSEISDLLDYLLCVGIEDLIVDKRKKLCFFLTEEQRKNIPVSDSPVSISKFVYSINELIDSSKMKKLKPATITSWLERNGFLSAIEYNEELSSRHLTSKSKEIGLLSETRTNVSAQ